MDKEAIVERVAKIHAEMETCKATYAKLEGHLGEAQYWMKELHAKEQEALEEALDEAAEETECTED